MVILSSLLAHDPVDQFDRRWHDRGYHRGYVREQLSAIEWKDGETIGELLDERCRSSRVGHRCERKSGHAGAHNADGGDMQWGGR
jgi:hypothetical protein